MSRFMQIRIHLEPVYKPDFQAHFPKLAEVLDELGMDIDLRRVTLYQLIQELERALYGDVRPHVRDTLQLHMPALRTLQKGVEEKLSTWQREGLDPLLYQIEDAFELLERDLD
jgi:hypothetical protein